MKTTGFTLVELVVVVTIIGILSSIAVPRYVSVIERAKIGKAKSAFAILLSAEKIYKAYKGTFVDFDNSDLVSKLGPYIDMESIANSDDDWDYSGRVSGGNVVTVIATRTGGGMYNGETITMNSTEETDGTHPLRW